MTRARARATRCCSPPESSPLRWVSRFPAHGREQLAGASVRCRVGLPAMRAGMSHVFQGIELGQEMMELEDEADVAVALFGQGGGGKREHVPSPAKAELALVRAGPGPQKSCKKRGLARTGGPDHGQSSRARTSRSKPSRTTISWSPPPPRSLCSGRWPRAYQQKISHYIAQGLGGLHLRGLARGVEGGEQGDHQGRDRDQGHVRGHHLDRDGGHGIDVGRQLYDFVRNSSII